MRFDLQEGFPLVTTKKCHLRSIIHELLWFLRGDTNISYLKENGVRIWDEWADEEGELGPVYGKQWRSWATSQDDKDSGIDQISNVIASIKKGSQTLGDSLLLPLTLVKLAKWLYPLVMLFFNFTSPKENCPANSTNEVPIFFLGVPFNIASYSLLTMMIAQVCELKLGEFIHTLGDAHLYLNHLEQARTQLKRQPRPLPKMNLNPEIKDIFSFKYEDFELIDYDPHPHIKAPVAV